MRKQLTEAAQARKEGEGRRFKAQPEDFEWVQQTDWRGEPMFRMVKPYTVTGLALALHTSRETLCNYEKTDKFSETIKRAKLVIHNFTEQGFIAGTISPSAAIFSLKNNYGWKDEQTHTHDVADTLADIMREANDNDQQGQTKE